MALDGQHPRRQFRWRSEHQLDKFSRPNCVVVEVAVVAVVAAIVVAVVGSEEVEFGFVQLPSRQEREELKLSSLRFFLLISCYWTENCLKL